MESARANKTKTAGIKWEIEWEKEIENHGEPDLQLWKHDAHLIGWFNSCRVVGSLKDGRRRSTHVQWHIFSSVISSSMLGSSPVAVNPHH